MAGRSSESDSRVLLKEPDDLEDANPEDEVPVWVAPAGSTLAEASNYNSAHDLPPAAGGCPRGDDARAGLAGPRGA